MNQREKIIFMYIYIGNLSLTLAFKKIASQIRNGKILRTHWKTVGGVDTPFPVPESLHLFSKCRQITSENLN